MTKLFILFMLFLTSFTSLAEAEFDVQPQDSILLTVFLKHDQSKKLDEIQGILTEQGFFETFPPKGVSVVSWYVMMGIGQVVTLEVPAHQLNEVNLAIEKTAWKAFTTEFYPTYNLYPIYKDRLKNKAKVSYK
ncbi:hypothetical protein Q4602_13680 [Paraglaciecola chathamensis]|uniref:hypothetical protein n=1 Tax=Paraglaciecola chathamensis TaxID=368405 RepID=UPI0026F9A880|nr:hypothetical protein [Paraglaciecola chathamensis]MDO6840531.1 hypothetical protein [Paraglaciecola chathamensis]